MGNYKNGIETKTALYQSARNCFYEQGYFNTSIRDIVGAANSRLGLFSYHFESKEAVAVMVFREYISNVATTSRSALGNIFDESDLLLNDMLNYRGYFTGLLRNENISRFFVELTTTACFLSAAMLPAAGAEHVLAQRGDGQPLRLADRRHGDPNVPGLPQRPHPRPAGQCAGCLF